ncbi:MAG: chaperone modulator CbpM [Pseudomonadales bacterium]|nr:chaperone modulator CbpM [Pseudomonadales bacterium]
MTEIYEVEILNEGHHYTLQELCQSLQADADFIVQCVDYGIAEVEGETREQWKFSTLALVRIQRAYRLQRDLDINFTGLGVVLDLLDDVEALRAQRNTLEKRLRHWEL